jgi:hypothetical protein
MIKRLKAFFETDLGELILHALGGVLGGVLGIFIAWWLVLVIWAAFFGREIGQHEPDQVGRVFTVRQVILEAHLPLLVGLAILIIFGSFP